LVFPPSITVSAHPLTIISPDTRRKIHLNPELSTDLVAPDQLLDMYGGDIEVGRCHLSADLGTKAFFLVRME